MRRSLSGLQKRSKAGGSSAILVAVYEEHALYSRQGVVSVFESWISRFLVKTAEVRAGSSRKLAGTPFFFLSAGRGGTLMGWPLGRRGFPLCLLNALHSGRVTLSSTIAFMRLRRQRWRRSTGRIHRGSCSCGVSSISCL